MAGIAVEMFFFGIKGYLTTFIAGTPSRNGLSATSILFVSTASFCSNMSYIVFVVGTPTLPLEIKVSLWDMSSGPGSNIRALIQLILAPGLEHASIA